MSKPLSRQLIAAYLGNPYKTKFPRKERRIGTWEIIYRRLNYARGFKPILRLPSSMTEVDAERVCKLMGCEFLKIDFGFVGSFDKDEHVRNVSIYMEWKEEFDPGEYAYHHCKLHISDIGFICMNSIPQKKIANPTGPAFPVSIINLLRAPYKDQDGNLIPGFDLDGLIDNGFAVEWEGGQDE